MKNKYRKGLVLAGYMSKSAVALADTLYSLAMKTIIEQHYETGEQAILRAYIESTQIRFGFSQPVRPTWEFRSRKACKIKQTQMKNGSPSKR